MNVEPTKLRIIFYPHPILRRKAAPVPLIDDRVRAVADRMIALMHQAAGVGLAAPQVNLGWRMFVANPTGQEGDDRVCINPELSAPTPETGLREEGCLSIPHVNGQIMRPVGITIRAQNLEGEWFEETSDELPARIWQHETDHLDGILILDRMIPVDKQANRRQIKALEADYQTTA